MSLKKERVSEASIVSRIRKSLEAWLDKGNWKQRKLLDWLKGYELPAIGHAEEPYIWLLRALSNSDGSHRQKMAGRVAAFLNEERPYQAVNGNFDAALLYNLFYLCCGLRCPEELSGPLYQVANFFEQHQEKQKLFITGSRYNLSGALRDALITNQSDSQFQNVWQQMLREQPHHLLQGNKYSGFEGLLYMRVSDKGREQPAVEQIGWALAQMSRSLTGDERRQAAFCRLLARVKETWDDYLDWDRDLLLSAIKHRWPEWAIFRLDTLVVPLGQRTDEKQDFLIWDLYLPYLKNFEPRSWSIVDNFVDGKIIEVCLDYQPSNLLNAIYHCVEPARLNCPIDSHRVMRLVADEALKNLREEWLHFKKEWEGADEKDSVFYRFLGDGRIEHLVASQPAERRETVRQVLRAAAASGG